MNSHIAPAADNPATNLASPLIAASSQDCRRLPGEPLLLRPADVAAQLQVSVRTIYALVATGHLRSCRIGLRSGAIRVHPQDLADYVARLRQSPGVPPVAGDQNVY